MQSILHALLCALPAAKAAAAVDPESEINHDDMEECQEDELEVTEAPAEAEDADALAGAKGHLLRRQASVVVRANAQGDWAFGVLQEGRGAVKALLERFA